MYDRHLDTFIQVADSGSFIKAGKALFISPNAVTKQINALERALDLTLFRRNNKGVVLTEAGRIIYEEAKLMISHSEAVLRKAHDLESRTDTALKIGVSLMHPFEVFMREWNKHSKITDGLKIQVVPFEDDAMSVRKVLEDLGENVDIVPALYDYDTYDKQCQGFHLCTMPAMISIPSGHRLSSKKTLKLEDLSGETLVTLKNGLMDTTDAINAFISKNYPDINLRMISRYEFTIFNQVVVNNELIVSADCWALVHPMLVTLPVEWDFKFNYGFVYAKNPSPFTRVFVDELKKKIPSK